MSMDKYEISQKILDLLDCDYDEIVDAIYKLANEVEKESEEEDDDTTELNICSGCIYENIDDTTDAISTCACCSRKVDFAKYDYYMR